MKMEKLLGGVLSWLDTVGTISCQSIRRITFTCERDCIMIGNVPAMIEIHRKLSEEATVEYAIKWEDYKVHLRVVREDFRARDAVKVPVLNESSGPHKGALTFPPGPW